MLRSKLASSNNPFLLPIKVLYYWFNNKYYDINQFIISAKVLDNSYIHLELKNGLKLINKPSDYPAQINFTERYKYGNKKKMNNIIDVEKYYFIYELIDELYLKQNYFEYFDLKENEIVVDAGANIGLFTVLAAKKLNNTGKVIAIEPDYDNYNILIENIKINNLTNVEVVKKGLWSKKKQLQFNIGVRPGEHSLFENEQMSGKNIIIECDTLDNILEELNIKQLDFMKMDIEGAEIEALKGCSTILDIYKPKLVIEALHQVDGIPTYKTVIPFLKDKNYEILNKVTNYRGTIYAIKY